MISSLNEYQELLEEFGWTIFDPSIHSDNYKEVRRYFHFDVVDPSTGFPDNIGLLRHAFEQYDENAPKIIKDYIILVHLLIMNHLYQENLLQ